MVRQVQGGGGHRTCSVTGDHDGSQRQPASRAHSLSPRSFRGHTTDHKRERELQLSSHRLIFLDLGNAHNTPRLPPITPFLTPCLRDFRPALEPLPLRSSNRAPPILSTPTPTSDLNPTRQSEPAVVHPASPASCASTRAPRLSAALTTPFVLEAPAPAGHPGP